MNGVSKITVTEDVALVTFAGIDSDLPHIADVFSEFARAEINIDMISQTAPQGRHIDISFTLPCDQLVKVLEQVNSLRGTHPDLHPMVSNGNCKIQLYGEEMRTMHGVAAAAISAIAKTEAELTLITTSEVDISLLTPQTHSMEAVAALESHFSLKSSL